MYTTDHYISIVSLHHNHHHHRWWLYIVSLFTKLCWKTKVESRVDVRSIFFVDGKIYRINEVVEERENNEIVEEGIKK